MIQYSKYIIGKVPAKIVGFIYLFSVLHICSLATRECADFIIDCILPKTPITVIVGSLILVCSFAVRGGGSVGKVGSGVSAVISTSTSLALTINT
ncbi:GerAB/ArcD/ProY family transporter [Bacillus anthracis]|nr:GerAB/ArcD/ProY family transporter [Bacillus anthracis]